MSGVNLVKEKDAVAVQIKLDTVITAALLKVGPNCTATGDLIHGLAIRATKDKGYRLRRKGDGTCYLRLPRKFSGLGEHELQPTASIALSFRTSSFNSGEFETSESVDLSKAPIREPRHRTARRKHRKQEKEIVKMADSGAELTGDLLRLRSLCQEITRLAHTNECVVFIEKGELHCYKPRIDIV